jgi:hypothetical protein
METMEPIEDKSGLVYESLTRNNKQIRKDRAESLGEDLEMSYKRQVEDIYSDLRKAKRSRDAMYDFSPQNAQSLVLASDVDGIQIAKEDMKISLDIRNLEIKYEIAVSRYKELYGKEFKI